MVKHSQKNRIVRPKFIRSPWVYALFFFSGISGLIYQIVWTRMLTLVFGHTIYSVSIVLSAFMAGLGLGSYLWGTTIDQTGKPLLTYGKIEVLIGITAAFLSLLLSNFSPIYSWLHQWLPDFFFLTGVLKAALAFSFVLIPAMLMGATLPITCKYFVTDENNLGENVSYLYAINTLGAAVGCLIAGYLLIGYFGVLQTALLAAGLNIFIGVISFVILKKTEPEVTFGLDLPKPVPLSFQFDKKNSLWVTISFLCGFTALAYEVVWTRLLVFGIGSTVYSFSLMLANFLFGITVGGLLIVPFFKKKFDFRLLLTIFQIGIGIYVIFSLFQSSWILSSFIRPLRIESPIAEFWLDMRNASALMFVPTILFGMSFPILTHLVTKGSQDIGSSLGIIYGTNTMGGILGSIVAGFLLLPNLGSQQTLTCLSMLNILTGMLLFTTSSFFTDLAKKGIAAALSCLLLIFWIEMPNDLLKGIFMRNSLGKKNPERLIYLEEGLTTTVAVFNDEDKNSGIKRKSLILNGVNMSATHLVSRQYMTLLSYIPLLLIENPKKVLVICFGTGLTSGAAGIFLGVNLVDAVDISPGVFRAAKLFSEENHDAVNNPKVRKIIQDGRNHLLTTSTLYDVITSEPPPPTQAGSVNLYTKEYYELTKQALKPGGIVSQWVPLHSQAEAHIYEHFSTFLDSFPYAMAWYPAKDELILIGSNDPINIDFNIIERHFQNPVINKIMRNIGFQNPISFLGTIWFLKKEMQSLSSKQTVISDNNPSLEFFLNHAKIISRDGIERLITNRAPFESVLTKISNFSQEGKKTLKNNWDWRIKEDYAEEYFESASTLQKKGALDEAMDHYRKAIGLNPSHFMAHNNLGIALAEKGKLEEAITHYRAAIEIKPDFISALKDLGIALQLKGDLDGAIDHYRKAVRLKPTHLIANYNLGNALAEKGEFEGAITHYRAAIEIKPDHFEAHYNLGNLLGQQDQLQKAQESFEKAISLDEKHPLPYYGLGIIFKRSGKNLKAIAAFKQALSLNPNLEQAHYFLGEIYDEMRQEQ